MVGTIETKKWPSSNFQGKIITNEDSIRAWKGKIARRKR